MLRRACPYLVLFLITLGTGCASRSGQPYVPPDTAAGKLRSIAYMPYFGVAVPPPKQDTLASYWAGWWDEVYPGTKWTQTLRVSEVLVGAGTLNTWASAERSFMQTGVLDPQLVSTVCGSLNVDGILQGAVFGADQGGNSSGFGVGLGGGGLAIGSSSSSRGSRASISVSLISCATKQSVWTASSEVSYKTSYSTSELVECERLAVPS
jgi:hypothetical protein